MTFAPCTPRDRFLASAVCVAALTFSAHADQVVNDDLVVLQSACIGTQCSDGEGFGNDTLRLKQNVIRVHFEDTSSGSAPGFDWRLAINGASSGNWFAVENASTNETPFTIDSVAPTDSLYVRGNIGFGTSSPARSLHVVTVYLPSLRLEQRGGEAWTEQVWDVAAFDLGFWIIDDANKTEPFKIGPGAPTDFLTINGKTGDVGLGTSAPATELHIQDAGTPTVRLEQDASGGFKQQTWDIAGNEVNFFVRDASNGSKLPFRIFAGAPADSVSIATDGNVGIGVAGALAPLHLRRSDGTARIYVQEGSVSQAARELLLLENFGGSWFTLKNTQSGRDWFFTHENNVQGRFIITASTNPSKGLFLSDTGNMKIGGVLTENSDRNAKMAIEPVDPAAILAKVAALPVSEWSYTDTEGVRHIGPMAQDFHALFGLGATETGISTLDTSGVALAAIQALAEQNAALQAELAHRTAEFSADNAALRAELADLRRLLAAGR